jgi:hypothetical protein
MEIIKGILIAAFCSCLALLLQVAMSLFRRGGRTGKPAIFELIRQVNLSSVIWVIVSILFVYLFFVPPGSIIVLSDRISRSGELPGYIYGIILYIILCFVYLSVYYLIDRSVSSTLLEIIENSPEGKLSAKQIKQIYGIENKYHSELKGMQEGGFITEESGFYRDSLKGRLYARLARLIKIIFKLGPGG